MSTHQPKVTKEQREKLQAALKDIKLDLTPRTIGDFVVDTLKVTAKTAIGVGTTYAAYKAVKKVANRN